VQSTACHLSLHSVDPEARYCAINSLPLVPVLSRINLYAARVGI